MDLSLVIPAFVAGLLTFLAPCTLPLVPGFLGFISGVSADKFKQEHIDIGTRRRVFLNGLMYVIGFSIVFIILGTVFFVALGQYRLLFSRVAGVFVIFFGLFLMGVIKFPKLNTEKRFNIGKYITPGKPKSSFLFGAAFAFGWSPCVGPVLGTVLTLAGSASTVGQGAFLMAIFSAGLAIPFLLLSIGIGHAAQTVKHISKYLHILSVVGGAFITLLGILMVTNSFILWNSFFYDALKFINYEALYDYL